MTGAPDAAALAARAAQAWSASLGFAYAWLAPDLVIRQTSADFARVLGAPGLQLAGQPLTDCVAEFVGLEADLRQVLAGQSPEFRLERINRRTPEGGLRYLDFWVRPGAETALADGLLLIVVDATATGELEQSLSQDRNELRLAKTALADANDQLQQVSRSKSFVLSMVAHDLRSPLAAIGGYAQLLSQAEPGPALLADVAASIGQLADRMNLLIDNLVDLDQVEQGRLRIDPVACDLVALIDEVAGALGQRAAMAELRLSRETPAGPLLAWADPGRMRQVLHNLLSNAIKYTPAGGVVRVAARQAEDRLILQVADTGRGMTSVELDHLFQLYYRTDEARHSKTPGTGLGLYIVKTLVEAQGGQITVESRPGRGTTFSVTLPGPAGD